MRGFQAALFASLVLHGVEANPSRPNVVLIITDDQDVRLNSLHYMPFLQKSMVQQGTTYEKHFCTM
jgi:N-acetylglucosamine-6-sulfatase